MLGTEFDFVCLNLVWAQALGFEALDDAGVSLGIWEFRVGHCSRLGRGP